MNLKNELIEPTIKEIVDQNKEFLKDDKDFKSLYKKALLHKNFIEPIMNILDSWTFDDETKFLQGRMLKYELSAHFKFNRDWKNLFD